MDRVRPRLGGCRQQRGALVQGTFFICCVALMAADGSDGTPKLVAIPSAMSTAGCFAGAMITAVEHVFNDARWALLAPVHSAVSQPEVRVTAGSSPDRGFQAW